MHRHGSSGVSKTPRRRALPLKEIAYDPTDKVAAKRARNTMAARESRARKVEHLQTVQVELDETREERDTRRQQVQQLSDALALTGYSGPLIQ
jgi:general control protein GCN4